MSLDFSLIQQSFNKYVVRPINAFGLGGFVFDVDGEATVNLTTEITDHYTEDNAAIQDHIAVKPKRVVLRNYVGELIDRRDNNTNTLLQNITQKLTIASGYLPALASATKQAKSIFEGGIGPSSLKRLTDVTVNQVVDLWGATKNLTPPIERQAQAYMFFKALCEQKILFSVQTPFEYMTNMAIESIAAYQGEESKYISDFSITLKEMRFAKTSTVAFDPAKYKSGASTQSVSTSTGKAATAYQGRTGTQRAPVVNRGKMQGIPFVTLSQQSQATGLSTSGTSTNAGVASEAINLIKAGPAKLQILSLPPIPGLNAP